MSARLHFRNLTDFRAGNRADLKAARSETVLAATITDVEEIQRFAQTIGVKLVVDGKPGPLTVRFIRTFQGAYSLGEYRTRPLKVDGYVGPATIAAVRHSASNGYRVSTNFRWYEYVTKNPATQVTRNNPMLMLDRQLVEGMQNIRDHYRKPVTIISGFRDPYWNSVVGGSKASQHLLGKAADFTITGARPTESVCARWFNGIGIARLSGRVSHVDSRATVTRWFYEGV